MLSEAEELQMHQYLNSYDVGSHESVLTQQQVASEDYYMAPSTPGGVEVSFAGVEVPHVPTMAELGYSPDLIALAGHRAKVPVAGPTTEVALLDSVLEGMLAQQAVSIPSVAAASPILLPAAIAGLAGAGTVGLGLYFLSQELKGPDGQYPRIARPDLDFLEYTDYTAAGGKLSLHEFISVGKPVAGDEPAPLLGAYGGGRNLGSGSASP